jgi:hypothetical protein
MNVPSSTKLQRQCRNVGIAIHGGGMKQKVVVLKEL